MASRPESFTYTFTELGIRGGMLEETMGYSEVHPPPLPLTELIAEVLEKADSLCKIRGGYILADKIKVDLSNKRIYSHGNFFETGQIVTHQLRRSERFAWFACTAGENISDYSAQLMQEGELLKGYIVDVLANIVVEKTMDMIQESLKNSMLSRGYKITNRYSPGYCEWDISEQKKLFLVFPGKYLDIALSESCLMKPLKSISGVIGIGKDVKYNEYTCNLCKDMNCMYRKRRGNDV